MGGPCSATLGPVNGRGTHIPWSIFYPSPPSPLSGSIWSTSSSLACLPRKSRDDIAIVSSRRTPLHSRICRCTTGECIVRGRQRKSHPVSDLSSAGQWTLHVVPVVGGEVLQGKAEDGEEQVEEVAHAQEQQ